MGVKHNSTWFRWAHSRIRMPLCAERLSRITWIQSPSGRAARIDFNAASTFAADFWFLTTPQRVSSPIE